MRVAKDPRGHTSPLFHVVAEVKDGQGCFEVLTECGLWIAVQAVVERDDGPDMINHLCMACAHEAHVCVVPQYSSER